MAVHVLLNELEKEVKLENVSAAQGQPKSPEFLKINPRGQVPVLSEDGNIIREGAAMMIYLMDKYESKMLPKSGMQRATALEWLAFANATLHPVYSRVFFTLRNVSDEKAKNQILEISGQQINKLWSEVNDRLANNKYICGDEISVADILLSVIANWGVTTFSFKVNHGENTKRMLKEVTSRASFKKALELEGVKYNAL